MRSKKDFRIYDKLLQDKNMFDIRLRCQHTSKLPLIGRKGGMILFSQWQSEVINTSFPASKFVRSL